ncbi:hypothetical protein FACS189449_11900 [Alphaproteobacteria bacterium]|nr:hypothetical protein FACS189449_11900 [Alphaproteobacteria bacterium]
MLTLRATDGSDAHKTDTTSTQPAETSDGKDITVGGNASTTTTASTQPEERSARKEITIGEYTYRNYAKEQ